MSPCLSSCRCVQKQNKVCSNSNVRQNFSMGILIFDTPLPFRRTSSGKLGGNDRNPAGFAAFVVMWTRCFGSGKDGEREDFVVCDSGETESF